MLRGVRKIETFRFGNAADRVTLVTVSVRLRVPPVEEPDFVAELSIGSVAELRLIGSADSSAQRDLAALLVTIHGELCDHKCREVIVDMTSLDLMAAPCFKELVEWLYRLQELEPDQRYRIRFRSNPSILWQKHSLNALSCFDTDLLTIES
ncbi:MAG: uncharacterized protein JWO36_1557 [Myxococcales bacterium]|nr:uncharacterized protein [Myxococcales bacterium]